MLSPRLIHGNSPLLHTYSSFQGVHEEDFNTTPGQFEDAETGSPPSVALQDQLVNASRALEELKETMVKQRQRRHSLATQKMAEAQDQRLIATGAATKLQGNLRATFANQEADLSCLETGDSEMRSCLTDSVAVGLGLDLKLDSPGSSDHLKYTIAAKPSHRLANKAASLQASSILLARRHWSTTEQVQDPDCNITATVPAKTRTANLSETHRAFSSQTSSSPILYSSAPNTPMLEAGAFSTPPTPVITAASSANMAQPATNSVPTETAHSSHREGTTDSAFTSTHYNQGAVAAIVSISATGSLVLIAALIYAWITRRRRSKRGRLHLEAVLEKVAPPPSPSNFDSDEKQIHPPAALGGIDSIDYFNATPHQSLPAISTTAEELRMISPWLSYDMGNHPFANAATKADRCSSDLASSGLISGHGPSKDKSFTWNFPKLSVPPAAARAMVTSHYVKKRIVAPPRPSNTSARLTSSISDEMFEDANLSSSIRPGSTHDRTDLPNLSTSASSECVDPEFDHRRKSFAVVGSSNEPPGWIKSALKHFTPNAKEAEVGDTSHLSTPWVPSLSSGRTVSEGGSSAKSRSESMTSQKKPLPAFDPVQAFPEDDFALTQAVVKQVLEIRLPSLSIANGPMLDVNECASLPSAKPVKQALQQHRVPLLKWGSGDKHSAAPAPPPPTPLRSVSNGTDTYFPSSDDRRITLQDSPVARRISWAGPVKSVGHREETKEDVKATREGGVRRLQAKITSRTSLAKQQPSNQNRSVWTQYVTDTEDEMREGYEAEQENDTEVEIDTDAVSTPVITLTSSEEEGRFERRISLISDQDMQSDTLHGHNQTQVEPSSSSSSSEGDLSLLFHSLDKISSRLDDHDDNLIDLDCLLADDFPTIPEWTPIYSPSRMVQAEKVFTR
ncbi:hypothetical protein CBS101457_003862 [Exobasidium rhododendri]|nr:hypothetical protein CBS101457_003862 [Exobasidium rhododendri]